MMKPLISKLFLASTLFIPISAGFVYFATVAQTYIHDQYTHSSFVRLSSLQNRLEQEFDHVEQLAGSWAREDIVRIKATELTEVLQSIVSSSAFISDVTFFRSSGSLFASTNEEFLSFRSKGDTRHPGLNLWPLDQAMDGVRQWNFGLGDFENYYLIPVKAASGKVAGVLAFEMSLSRLESFLIGALNPADRGFTLSLGETTLVQKADSAWPSVEIAGNDHVKSFDGRTSYLSTSMTAPFGNSATMRLTLARDWTPVVRLGNRVDVFMLGFSSFCALLFFGSVFWFASREVKKRPTVDLGVQQEIRIMPSDQTTKLQDEITVDKAS